MTILVKIKGGLGNQMFQYAIARSLSDKMNNQFYLDISWFYKQNKRKFSLEEFNIQAHLIKKINIFKKIWFYIFNNYSKEKEEFVFDKNVLKQDPPIYLDGYWQNERYFKNIRNILIKEFSFKNKPGKEFNKIKNNIQNSDSISIHFRRGDYVKNKKIKSIYGAPSLEYYKKAVKRINEKIKDPVFFIFSDDINWVKNNFKMKKNIYYVSDNILKDTEELILMSYCKHNIIANSTFSWWGAWLNKNKEKIVVAPERWTNDTVVGNCNVIPEYWTKI